MKKNIFYIIICILLVGAVSYLTVYNPPINYFHFLLFRIALILLVLISILKLFHQTIIKNKRLTGRQKNVGTLFYPLVLFFLFIEMVFTFVPRSHGVGFAYAAKNWKYYYVKNNELGFRDSPFKDKKLDKRTILFLGDSFTKGVGINKVQNRFANLFNEKVKECSEMVLYATGGLNTVDQLALLRGLSFKPEIIIFQYFGNDIEGDAIKMGNTRQPIVGYKDLPIIGEAIVRSSYLLNYIYWLYPRTYLNSYRQYLNDNYKNEEIFSEHKRTLRMIQDYAKANDIKLYCLVLPFLQNIEFSKELYFDEISAISNNDTLNSIVINVLDDIESLPLEDRVVNSNDPHASEKVHKIIADKLYEELKDFCE